MLLGPDYRDEGLVICTPYGAPMHPKTFSYHFAQAVKKSRLPSIRLHDLGILTRPWL